MRLQKPGMFLLCATLLIACRNQDSTFNISLVNKGPDTLSDRVSRMTRTLSPKNNSQVSGALKDLGAVGQFLGSEGIRQVSASIVGLVAQGGGTLVAQGGGTLVAQGGGTLVAQGGGTLVAQGGGTLVAQGGGTLVSSNGGTLISSNGGTLLSQAQGAQPFTPGNLLRQLFAVRTSPDGKVTVTYNDKTGAIEQVKSDLGDMTLAFPSPAPTTGPNRTRSLEATWNQSASGITGRFTVDWTGIWKPRAALTPRPAPSVAVTCQPSIAPTPVATTASPQALTATPAATPLPAMVLFDGELPETTEQAKLTASFGLPGDRTLAASILIDTPKAFKDGSTEPSHLRLDLSLADTVFFADVNDMDGETRANGRLTTKGEKGSEKYSFEAIAPDDGVGSLIIYSLDERDQAYFKLQFKLLPPTTPCGPRSFVGELFQPDSKAKLAQKFADCLPVPENPNQLLIKFTNGQTVLWDFLTVAAE